MWVLSNICHHATDKKVLEHLCFQKGCFDALNEIFKLDQDSGTMMALAVTTVKNLLMTSELCRDKFKELGGEEILEGLQFSPFYEVYQEAAFMVETFYGGQAVEADELEAHRNITDFMI